MYGGVETLLTTLARCRQLCPEMEPHFALCFEGRLSRELAAQNVPVYLLEKVRVRRPWTVARGRRSLHRLLKDEHFDAVVTHMSWAHMIFGSVVLSHTPNRMYFAHSCDAGRPWTGRWAARTKPAAVIANSHFVGRATRDLFKCTRTEVIHYPVWSAHERAGALSRSEIRRELGADGTAVVVIQ